jgi:Tol biopolymer transport system component
MSVSFDWQIEQEDRLPHWPSSDTPPPDRRRRWLWRGIAVFVLLVAAGSGAYLWISSRLKAVEKAEAELRRIVELELTAIADGDAEIFRIRQDPSNLHWRDQQVIRYFSPEAQFVPAPGLTPSSRPPEIEKVHFFGQTGRVELTHWFQPTNPPNGRTNQPTNQPLPFHATWFFRQNEAGTWYHVAPPDDYWGIPYSWHGSRLDIRATEVEAEALDPIADELARLMARSCDWLGCPPDARYSLSFQDVSAPQTQGDRWVLPALYLAGLPDGEQANDAWARALELWLVETLARAQVGDDAVTQRIFYRQLVARLKAELGLAEAVSPDVELLTEALQYGGAHPLWRLWQAEYDPDEPEETRLYEAEVAAVLDLIGEQVGSERIFELLPALGDHYRLTDVLTLLYDVSREDFTVAWSEHLSELTGVAIAGPYPPISLSLPPDQPLEPPPTPDPPAAPPGDQIALNCDGRIWVGNVDGSDMFLLTAANLSFSGLLWSPDGRWLLTTWSPQTSLYGALYLLAADGSGGRLLTDESALSVWPISWTPDERQAIYAAWYDEDGGDQRQEIRMMDIETGATRSLQGLLAWSPDGAHVAYTTGFYGDGEEMPAVWLVDGSDPAVHQDPELAAKSLIVNNASAYWLDGSNWSPDSSKLALMLMEENGIPSAIAVYDLATEHLTTLISWANLTTATLSFERAFVTDGADPTLLADQPMQGGVSLGWSADSRHLLTWAVGDAENFDNTTPEILAAVPVDGSAPRVLAYGVGRSVIGAAWSPTDPNRLIFTWARQGGFSADAFLFDLDAGPIYTATSQGWVTPAWSPDGNWIAFAKQRQVVFVDRDGQEHFTIDRDSECYYVAWNPVADLSRLGD